LVVKVVTGSGLAGAVEELDEVGLGWQPAGDVAGSRIDHPNRRVGIDVRVAPVDLDVGHSVVAEQMQEPSPVQPVDTQADARGRTRRERVPAVDQEPASGQAGMNGSPAPRPSAPSTSWCR
jgi:hypothetical protein